MHVLVTGGAGYVGSNIVHTLISGGHRVTVVDDLSSGHRDSLSEQARLVVGSCGDVALLRGLSSDRPDGVMHMAAKCSVGESMESPSTYYATNVVDSLALLDWMVEVSVPWVIHSSTCAVYGPVEGQQPLDETACPRPMNAYGATKLAVDRAIRFYSEAYGLRGTCLRYFNAAGAGNEGRLGEDKTPASNLIPAVLTVALGQRQALKIFGSDFDTPDGTGVRDYVHVSDLADAHVLAMMSLVGGDGTGNDWHVFNLGTGAGSSVLEVVEMARQVTGHAIPTELVAPRAGDPPFLTSGSTRAAEQLGWRPSRSDLRTVIEDAWRWHHDRPGGYGASTLETGGGSSRERGSS